MTAGMLLACVAFFVSALLEFKIQEEFMVKNSAPNSIQVINLTPFDLRLNTTYFNETISSSNQLSYQNEKNINFTLSLNNLTDFEYSFLGSNDKNLKNNFLVYLEKSTLKRISMKSSIQNEPVGKSQLRVYFLNDNVDAKNFEASIETMSKSFQAPLNITNVIQNKSFIDDYNNYKDVDFDQYQLSFVDKISNSSITRTYRLDNGARYTFILFNNGKNLNLVQIIDIYGYQINFAIQFIQYFIITCAEIMFSISGLTFAYSQAPESMKSILQAAWLLTVAFGNLIVVIIAEANLIKNQVYEYILFAVLIFVSAIVFAIMSYFYVYVEVNAGAPAETPSSDDDNIKKEKNGEDLKFNNCKHRKGSTNSDVQLVRMSALENVN
jgi:hypothetical protein